MRKSVLLISSLTIMIVIGTTLCFTSIGNIQTSYKITVPTSQIYTLTDREYYYSIIDDVRNANYSVMVAMYSIVYDSEDTFDWANDLIRELIYARERGVNVTVILEYRTYWNYMDENLDAYNYLSANGVNILLDNDTETDHMKLVIIDDYIVYIGSHNWSESGLYYNRESSIKIVSPEIAKVFKEYFWTICQS